jgi:hypothetical protein
MLFQLWLHTCYISFWIRRQDLAERHFDRIWLDLQTS